MPAPISPEQVAQIRRLYRPGLGPAVARIVGCNARTVQHYTGGTAHGKGTAAKVRAARVDAACVKAGRLHAGGMQPQAIVDELGLRPCTVRKHIRRYYELLGVPPEVWHRRGQRAAVSA